MLDTACNSEPLDRSSNNAEDNEPITLDRRWQYAIAFFMVIYFSCGIISLIPPSPMQAVLAPIIRPVELMLGLEQNWRLFSPELRSINFHSEALITFEDGSVRIYEFPRLEKADAMQAFLREKLRKLLNDCMPWPDSKVFLADVARFIAKANNNPEKKPVFITLAYWWIDTPDPNHWVRQDQLPQESKRYTYFLYRVRPEDLK